jgi:hypothetical protein
MSKRLTMVLIYTITIFSAVNFAQAPIITKEPLNSGVIEGQTANFLIEAQGDSLTYQWYKNDTLIVSATDSMYTTPATVLSDNNSKFKCVVTNPSGSDTSNSATLFVTAVGNRVTASLIAAYDFKEGSGTTINDISGVSTTLNLTIQDTSAIEWKKEGLYIKKPTDITSVVPASKIIDSCKLSNELSIEMWVSPKYLTQGNTSSSSIISLSIADQFRNFALQQIGSRYEGRVRTTETSNNAFPPTVTSNGIVKNSLTHLVLTRASNGIIKLYVDGNQKSSDSVAGDFLNSWSATHLLAIGGTSWGGERWLGTFHYTSIYNRSLSDNEIINNYSLGIDTIPFITKEPRNEGTIEGKTVEFVVEAAGVSPLTYQWQKNGVNITGANTQNYETDTLTLADDNSTFRVIVSNTYGSDTSNSVTLSVSPSDDRVTGGLVVNYKFTEGSGTVINDLSGVGAALNLQINTPAAVEWTDYGLNVKSAASIQSSSAATKLYDALTSTNEVTIEVWLKPSLETQSAEIITLSQDVYNRNFMLMQENDDTYQIRLRTQLTNNQGHPHFPTPSGLIQNTAITQIVFTRKNDGTEKIYVNGSEVSSIFREGDFSNWNASYPLAIADEITGGYPWVGLYNNIAIYDRALNDDEVEHNFIHEPEGGWPSIKAPGELTAQAKLSRVELAWIDSSDNEDGFIIERKYDAFDFAVIDSVISDVTSYIDSNVVDTTTYVYRVKAYNIAVESSYSNEDSATTILSTLAAPTSLTANLHPTIINRALLSWQDNSSNELGFIVERKTGDSASVDPYAILDTLAANSTSYVDSTLADTTTYTFRVIAFNEFILSDYSNLASVTTILSSLAAPTNLTVNLHPTIVNRALLSWQDNSPNELGFIVERKTGDSASVDPYTVLDTLTANLTSFEDSTLADTTTYTFRVKAFNTLFESDYSNLASITTVLSTLVAPTNLEAKLTGPSNEFVGLNWIDNSTNELGFVIERKPGDTSVVSPFVVIDSVGIDVTTYTDSLVMLDSTYSYRVYAFNSYFVSDYSNLSDVRVPVELVSFTANIVNSAVQLRWETASETNNSGFSIQRSKDNSKFTDIAFVKGTGTTTEKSTYSYSDKSALSGKYYYRLKQVDFDGSFTYSNAIEVDLGIPKDYVLEQNYPNPFNPSTTIRFGLPINAKVSIKLYNALGQEVKNILNAELEAGIHETVLNASNLSSGVYFYTLKVQGANGSNFKSTKRMILMK